LNLCLISTDFIPGRLSNEEIERMIFDAEQFKNDDKKQSDRIAAKNVLENCTLEMKSTVKDDKMKDEIDEDEKKIILEKCDEVIEWLDDNQLAEKEEFEKKQKEIETVCNPIITKMYLVTI